MAVSLNTKMNLHRSLAQLQIYINSNGRGPTNTINRVERAGILVALQQGHSAIDSGSASRLPQISKQTFHPTWIECVKAQSGIIGNEGADACARAAALADTRDIALSDARDPSHNFYWLTLKSSHGRNGNPHHSHTTPTHYLNNLIDKLKYTHAQ
eukprot:1157171-Pelagomonas_calceolata.AAC.2